MLTRNKIILFDADLKRLEEIKAFIDANMDKKLTEAILSSKYGTSISTLKRHFSCHFNSTIYRFLLDTRMKKAMQLLVTKKTTVNQVASLVGYTDCSAFTHKFTKYFGNPPAFFLRNNHPFDLNNQTFELINHDFELIKQTRTYNSVVFLSQILSQL